MSIPVCIFDLWITKIYIILDGHFNCDVIARKLAKLMNLYFSEYLFSRWLQFALK